MNLKDISLKLIRSTSSMTTKYAYLSLSNKVECEGGQEKGINFIFTEKFAEVVSHVINFALANEPVNLFKNSICTSFSRDKWRLF